MKMEICWTDKVNHTIRKINLVGDTVNFRVDFADAAGNSGSVDNTTDNSLVKVDLEAPVILNDNITSTNQDPNWVKYGDNVTLSFSTSEPIQDPSDNISIDGLTDIVVVGSDNLTEWTATGQVASNATGMANYSISVKDLTGNVATPVTSTTSINLDTESPSLSDVVLSSSNTTNSSYAKAGDNLTLTFNASELIETPVVTLAGDNLSVQDTNMERGLPGRQPTRFRMETTGPLPSASSIRIRLEIRDISHHDGFG